MARTRDVGPKDVLEARQKAGLTRAAAATKVRGSASAWVKWESEDEKEHRTMHPGLFELFLIKTGQPVPDWLKG